MGRKKFAPVSTVKDPLMLFVAGPPSVEEDGGG
jgi:hypothetical protein